MVCDHHHQLRGEMVAWCSFSLAVVGMAEARSSSCTQASQREAEVPLGAAACGCLSPDLFLPWQEIFLEILERSAVYYAL